MPVKPQSSTGLLAKAADEQLRWMDFWQAMSRAYASQGVIWKSNPVDVSESGSSYTKPSETPKEKTFRWSLCGLTLEEKIRARTSWFAFEYRTQPSLFEAT